MPGRSWSFVFLGSSSLGRLCHAFPCHPASREHPYSRACAHPILAVPLVITGCRLEIVGCKSSALYRTGSRVGKSEIVHARAKRSDTQRNGRLTGKTENILSCLRGAADVAPHPVPLPEGEGLVDTRHSPLPQS